MRKNCYICNGILKTKNLKINNICRKCSFDYMENMEYERAELNNYFIYPSATTTITYASSTTAGTSYYYS